MDSPVKLGPLAARRMRVGLGEEQSARRAILNLNDELEDMSQDDIEALGQSIFSMLKAISAKETDSPFLKGKVFKQFPQSGNCFSILNCDGGKKISHARIQDSRSC